MTEAMRLAFADRAVWMGDEDFVQVPKTGLLDPDYVATRSALINPTAAWPRRRQATRCPTTSAAIGDKNTNLAAIPSRKRKRHRTRRTSPSSTSGATWSATPPRSSHLGHGHHGAGLRLSAQQRADRLQLHADAERRHRQPRRQRRGAEQAPALQHGADASLFKDGEPVAAYGSPGGSTIINSVLNVTLNLIDHGMTIQQAIDAPRLSVTSAAGRHLVRRRRQAFMQPAFSVATQDALRALGHAGPGCAGGNGCTATIGSVQGVVIDLKTGKQYGGADPRREGTVIGLKRRHGHHDGHDDREHDDD